MRLSESLAELPTLDEIREERARRSLNAFTRRLLGLEPARHHLFVNEKLEAIPAEIRLRALMKKMNFHKTDLLAIERIRGKMAPYALYWSVGAVITNHKYDSLIEVPIFMWKEFEAHDYFKDDEQDALTMGTTLIEIAERFEEYNECQY